jgi:hypothetical protein
MVADTMVSGSLSGSLSTPFAVMTLVVSVVSSFVESVSSTATGGSLASRKSRSLTSGTAPAPLAAVSLSLSARLKVVAVRFSSLTSNRR